MEGFRTAFSNLAGDTSVPNQPIPLDDQEHVPADKSGSELAGVTFLIATTDHLASWITLVFPIQKPWLVVTC